jgi:hypothetical protein
MIAIVARRGALLPMVLVAMVIIALAACAALFTARQQRAASWHTRLQTEALAAVDAAHAEQRHALARVAHSIEPGSAITRHGSTDPGAATTTRLTRLGTTLFLLAAEAGARSAQGLSARRRAALLLRLDPPSLGVPDVLNITGVSAPAPGISNGADHVPAGWTCDTARSDTARTLHPSPAPDQAVLAELRRRASFALPAASSVGTVRPTEHEGACVTDRADNWGDPDRRTACASWLPIIHASGDLEIDGGAGQGTLLVDGDLVIRGGFRFVGVVVVRGTINVGAGGAALIGAVTAGAMTDGSGSHDAAPIVLRSTCSTAAALIAAGALVPVSGRSWASVR